MHKKKGLSPFFLILQRTYERFQTLRKQCYQTLLRKYIRIRSRSFLIRCGRKYQLQRLQSLLRSYRRATCQALSRTVQQFRKCTNLY
jgi:hypothetical protein